MKKLNKFDILFFLIMIPYLKPYNVTLNTTLNEIFMVWKLISTLSLLIIFVLKVSRISKVNIYILLFLGVWSASIYMNCKTLTGNIQEILSIVGLVLLSEIVMKYDNKMDAKKSFLKVLYSISSLYILLNFITILLQRPLFGTPINIYDIYFLGGDNYSAFILLPLCSFIHSYDLYTYKKIRLISYIFSIIGLIGLFIQFSVAGMIAYGIYILLMINKNNVAFKKIFTYKNIIIIILLFLSTVIFLNIQNYLTTILEFFGKQGLSSREIIWKSAFSLFTDNFLIGIGQLNKEQVSQYLLYGSNHTHNIILEYLVDTGVLGTFFISTWVKKIFYIKSSENQEVIDSLKFAIVAYLLCSIFDFYIGLVYFYLLIITLFVIKKPKEEQ